MPFASSPATTVLALDLGVASIGWSLFDQHQQRFLAAGARIFDAAMDEAKFAKGEPGASKNLERRTARLHRRQLRRRAARQRELFCLLQRTGLLPAHPSGHTPDSRHQLLTLLDAQFAAIWQPRLRTDFPSVVAPHQVLPYLLRAHALDHPLHPYELGRALYHLGQRRGYKSNRREGRSASDSEPDATTNTKSSKSAKEKNPDDRKVVLAAITDLESQIKASGARTLGEFFCRLDPAAQRIRTQHTARKMFEDEFNLIWSAQLPHHPGLLTPDLQAQIRKLLFDQRPIAPGKPGVCELEPTCCRAERWRLSAQRFRLLQKVNDLAIVLPLGNDLPLTPDQRATLAEALETRGDLTFPRIREVLALPRKTHFNFEAGGDKKLPGNRTASVLLKAFGANLWRSFSAPEQNRISALWASEQDGDTLAAQLIAQYQLNPHAAADLARHEPEDGYSSLSPRALSRLLPRMEQGEPFKTAEKAVYGVGFSGAEPKDSLPPVEDVLPKIPNPAVMRSLTELRKLVNAIIRQYGKPARVRIELARDLKRNAKDRQTISKRNSDNRTLRAKLTARIIHEARIPNPSGKQIEKASLHAELQACLYCGKTASFASLFNDPAFFEVDHILPRNRFPDDSFNNKTIACVACNRAKLGRTPFEAFAADAAQWEAITVRASSFRNPEKKKAVLLENSADLDDFTARHLADTRYISKMAAQYLGQLYGGRDRELPDLSSERAVFASSGEVTATLRRWWGLEEILREPPASANGHTKGKPRTDHRHHAVDAIAIALTSQSTIQRLNAESASNWGPSNSRFSGKLPAPIPNLVEAVRPLIENLNVSHRPVHRLNGPLHDETFYSRPHLYGKKEQPHVRKCVHLLTEKAINAADVIVDPRVRTAVQAKLAEVGGNPKKLENNWPLLLTRHAKHVPIRKVRIRVSAGTTKIAQGERERFVALNANHHIPLFLSQDKKGNPCWDTSGVVSRFEAMQRQRRGELIVQKNLPDDADAKFLFSLMGGDLVQMNDPKLHRLNLYVVRTISQSANDGIELDFVRHTDARIIAEIKETKDWDRITRIKNLLDRHCQKVTVDLLGRVHPAHD